MVSTLLRRLLRVRQFFCCETGQRLSPFGKIRVDVGSAATSRCFLGGTSRCFLGGTNGCHFGDSLLGDSPLLRAQCFCCGLSCTLLRSPPKLNFCQTGDGKNDAEVFWSAH